MFQDKRCVWHQSVVWSYSQLSSSHLIFSFSASCAAAQAASSSASPGFAGFCGEIVEPYGLMPSSYDSDSPGWYYWRGNYGPKLAHISSLFYRPFLQEFTYLNIIAEVKTQFVVSPFSLFWKRQGWNDWNGQTRWNIAVWGWVVRPYKRDHIFVPLTIKGRIYVYSEPFLFEEKRRGHILGVSRCVRMSGELSTGCKSFPSTLPLSHPQQLLHRKLKMFRQTCFVPEDASDRCTLRKRWL